MLDFLDDFSDRVTVEGTDGAVDVDDDDDELEEAGGRDSSLAFFVVRCVLTMRLCCNLSALVMSKVPQLERDLGLTPERKSALFIRSMIHCGHQIRVQNRIPYSSRVSSTAGSIILRIKFR